MLSTAMHRRIEHLAAELLICRTPASICNTFLVQLLRFFFFLGGGGGGGGVLRKKRWLLGLRPRPQWGSLQRFPTPPSWVPPSRTLPGAAPIYYFAPPFATPSPVPPPPPPPPPSQFACDRSLVSRRHINMTHGIT